VSNALKRRPLGATALVALVATGVLALTAATLQAAPAKRTAKPDVVIGLIGARVGPIANIGQGISQGTLDWIAYTNAKGGVNGRKIKVVEIESEYQVPKAVAAYQQLKAAGAAAIIVSGTASSETLRPVSATDHLPILFPGQGGADLTDGSKYPYAFPLAPTYPHQAGAALAYFMKEWKKSGHSAVPRIACIGWDNVPGREYCTGLKIAADILKANLVDSTYVAQTAIDATPQVLEIKGANPDAVFSSTAFKQATATLSAYCDQNIKAPLFVWHWAFSENEIDGAGPACAAKAQYTATAMSSLRTSKPQALQQLLTWWRQSKQKFDPVFVHNLIFSNGVAIGALVTEGVRKADAIAGNGPITAENMKTGFERLNKFRGGIVCPTTTSASNHGGNRSLNIYRYRNGTVVQLAGCVKPPFLTGAEPSLG
jgi:branched-chain amino acid transport system substrate-binding protein